EPEPPRRKQSRAEPDPAPRAAARPTTTRRAAPERAPLQTTLTAARIDPNRAAEQLAAIEKEFLALDVAADDPARADLWNRMAPLNASLNGGQDAALCWARVVWELPPDEGRLACDAWFSAEQALVRNASAETLLALDHPAREHARALAVSLLRGDASL